MNGQEEMMVKERILAENERKVQMQRQTQGDCRPLSLTTINLCIGLTPKPMETPCALAANSYH
jgi:hypothetical protein